MIYVNLICVDFTQLLHYCQKVGISQFNLFDYKIIIFHLNELNTQERMEKKQNQILYSKDIATHQIRF